MVSAALSSILVPGRVVVLGLVLGLFVAHHGQSTTIGLVSYVNTLRGSNSTFEYSRGNTFPAVTRPFGFNFWTPITEGNSSSWLYRFDRETLQGFGVSHQPSPWIGDYAAIQIMPQVGTLQVAPHAREAKFSHSSELARPDYYSVHLDTSGIRVEMTPADRAAFLRFTFPEAKDAYLLFDSIDTAQGEVRVVAARRSIEGHVDLRGPRLYFVAQLDVPFSVAEVSARAGVSAAVRLETGSGEVVGLRMATSYISVDQALANLEDEIGDRTFDELRAEANRSWQHRLSAIEVEGASEREKVTFYSNLYRSFMYPNAMWESTGDGSRYYSPYDNRIHAGKIWVNNGFWDTYRAAWPLYLLFVPEAEEMLNGFVRAYRDGGWTPRWSGPGYQNSMLGTHVDSVFADAYLKGRRGFDVHTAYESMLKNALVQSDEASLGRRGNEHSIFRGYVPASVPESAAWSLENYVNDFGISQLAEALGDAVHARYFRSRALGYLDLYSPSVGFFRGRNLDGSWRTSDADFRSHEWGYEFTEGNAWHYSLAANHDPQGMANLYGGRSAMAAKVDAVFDASRDFLPGSYGGVIHEMREAYDTNLGQYAHANEPTHHLIYMYNYAGAPSKTQRRIRDVLDERRGLYGPGDGDGGGYLGDEDNGQMSAWYVFSAIGFYPASPSQPEYAIGSPLFKRISMRLANGKRFVVSAPRNDAQNIYVQKAALNGRTLTRNYLTHAELIAGGELELDMGPQPSSWGSGPDDLPSSLTVGENVPERLRDQTSHAEIVASSEADQHAAALAFDDDSRTEWLAPSSQAWISARFADQGAPLQMYTVTSGRSDPAMDPTAWILEASSDGIRWDTVDQRRGQAFKWRRHTRVFPVSVAHAGPHYRLRIERNAGGAEIRVAELELLWSEAAPGTASAQKAE